MLELRRKHRTFCVVQCVKRADEGLLRFSRAGEAHFPELLCEVRPEPRVLLDVSRHVNTAVDNRDVFSEHRDDGPSLRVVAVTDERFDAWKRQLHEGQKADEGVRCSVSDEAPGQGVHGLGLVAARHRNKGNEK